MASDAERKPPTSGDEAPSAGFRVSDRRAFTRDGEPRQPAEPGPAGPEREPAAPEHAPGAETPPAEPARPPGEHEEAPPSLDFVAFVQSLYFSALMSLGELENPYTHQREVNLDLARQNIDILQMLHEKTRGNLEAEERGLLEQVLPHLQLLYVKKAG